MGKIFTSLFYNTDIKLEMFEKFFLLLRNYGMDFLFSGNNGNIIGKALNNDKRYSLKTWEICKPIFMHVYIEPDMLDSPLCCAPLLIINPQAQNIPCGGMWGGKPRVLVK